MTVPAADEEERVPLEEIEERWLVAFFCNNRTPPLPPFPSLPRPHHAQDHRPPNPSPPRPSPRPPPRLPLSRQAQIHRRGRRR